VFIIYTLILFVCLAVKKLDKMKMKILLVILKYYFNCQLYNNCFLYLHCQLYNNNYILYLLCLLYNNHCIHYLHCQLYNSETKKFEEPSESDWDIVRSKVSYLNYRCLFAECNENILSVIYQVNTCTDSVVPHG